MYKHTWSWTENGPYLYKTPSPLSENRALLCLGVPHALNTHLDNLRRSSEKTIGGDNSHLLHLLHGVTVSHEARRVSWDALHQGMKLGEELLRRLPLDAQSQCLAPK
jgi:hypothetical protein